MHVRWQVLAGLCILSFITIVDRVCISAAKPPMAAELAIPDVTFGVVFGMFALGYGVFMLPSGWAADRLGARTFLSLIVTAWSLLTVATGLVTGVTILIVIRFLFGAAEAGAFPTAARAIYGWLPRSERGLALGLLNTGSRMGAAIGLSLMSASIAAVGWRASFVLLGVLGLVWSLVWFLWFRDNPAEMRRVSPEELQWIQSDSCNVPAAASVNPVSRLVSTDSAFLLLQYFASNFTFFLCFSWLLPYLRDRFQLGPYEAGLYSSIPLYCGALATWTSGLTVDAIFRRGHWNLSRRLPGMFGFGLAAIMLVIGSQTESLAGFVLCFSLTTFGVDFTLSPSWSASADLGGKRVGTLSAAMNTAGSIGSFASSVTFPWLLVRTGSATPYLMLAAAIDVAAVILWWRIRTDQRE
jgi:ACS family glucarate transporter-like MFS transporter